MAENTNNLAQKYACRFCDRRFKRPDHVQRHERRHTKETPYPCPCGQAFSRHDLLTRHQKLAHQMEPAKRRKIEQYSAPLATTPQLPQDPLIDQRTLVANQDINQQDFVNPDSIFSNSGLPGNALDDFVCTTGRIRHGTSQHEPEAASASFSHGSVDLPQTLTTNEGNDSVPAPENYSSSTLDFGLPHFDMDHYLTAGDFFADDLNTSSPALFKPINLNGLLQLDTPGPYAESPSGRSTSIASEQQQVDVAPAEINVQLDSRIGSPLPSLRTLSNLGSPLSTRPAITSGAPIPCWKVSQEAYERLQILVQSKRHLIDAAFKLPSRHMMSHFLERCINSLYKHQPCLHIPTFRPVDSPLALILSMCAVGAQLRFESETGISFFNASKACLMANLQSSHRQGVIHRLTTHEVKAPAVYEQAAYGQKGESTFSANTESEICGTRLQSMQTLLTLMSFGSWGPKSLLAETLTLQSMLAMLAREEGLGHEPELTQNELTPLESRWKQWISAESSRRIKTIAFYFTQLQSLAYGMPPPILTAELRCHTPCSAHEWAATSSQRWRDIQQQKHHIKPVSFQVAFQALFHQIGDDDDQTCVESSDQAPPVSAMGLYALIFGILQRIFFLRQCRPFERKASLSDFGCSTSLHNPEFDEIVVALHRWQQQWERCPESTVEPEATSGPISFNAIACLRMAWIRLYADISPCRNLATRDPAIIAQVFVTSPTLRRHSMLAPIILQAIHAMSVPVRLGVKFVSRSQTMFWSVNQSLCILECAVVLQRWFEALEADLISHGPTNQEQKLLIMLTDIVIESDLIDGDELQLLEASQDLCEKKQAPSDQGIRQHSTTDNGTMLTNLDYVKWDRYIQALSRAVAKVWAEIFSNSHVFEVVTIIGKTLSLHAETRAAARVT